MGFIADIQPHITSIVTELPTVALQAEVADALAYHFDWEQWRTTQDPPVANTDNNRRTFARDRAAKWIRDEWAGWLRTYRSAKLPEEDEIEG